MDAVARQSAEDRAALFGEAAARAGISALVVEKDFWVCWTLKRLYGLDGLPRLLFKGGTSLSKCFGLIRRFSEDIDLGLEREDLGLGGALAPSSERGSSSQKQARKRLQQVTRAYVQDTFLPAVQADFRSALAAPFELRAVEHPTECVIEFQYPRALGAFAYGSGAYVSSVVKLELGARSDHHPIERVEIRPYAAEQVGDWFQVGACAVIAQAPERTLLEKALILHTDIARGRLSGRVSRHAYDLAMMQRAGTSAKVTFELFEQVAIHKLVFSDDRHARRAPEQGISIVPEGPLQVEMKADYHRMNEMFFEVPPSFDEVLAGLHSLQSAINALGPRR